MGRVKRHLSLLLSVFLLFSLSVGAKAQIYRKKETEKKKIAISFDDGPSKQNTDEILSILEEYHIRATFFVIGQNAVKDPERIQKIHDAGHEIGNHTYTHAYISKISEESLRKEVKMTEDLLFQITGEKPVVFRPPGGFYNDKSISVLDEMGYKSVLWSLDTRDWSFPKWESIASKVEERCTTGDIILFHDLDDKRLTTPAALRKILPCLIENGYEFVTISELLEEAD